MSKGIKVGLFIFILGAGAYIGAQLLGNKKSNIHLNTEVGSIGKASQEREKTAMSFAQSTHDFGVITEGEVKEYSFQFKNTGNAPLHIEHAKGSCGCTVPQWPKDPVAPGATGQIVVKFNSANKVGKNSKKVTIVANTEPISTVLTITAEVKSK
jgi:hypothetical protein